MELPPDGVTIQTDSGKGQRGKQDRYQKSGAMRSERR